MSTIFLDRDGVINENLPGYVTSWQAFHFLPGAREAIARLTRAGHRIIVCTNQAGVAQGEFTYRELDDIHQRMCREVEACGGYIERVYACTHHKYEGCACRKPQPGLLLQAARDLLLDLNDAVFVGDSMSDMQAGLSAGVHPILVLTGRGRDQLRDHVEEMPAPFLVSQHLAMAADAILQGMLEMAMFPARV